MRKYERVAGIMTRGETFAKLNEILIEAEELMAMMGHLHMTEDSHRDEQLASGWRGMSQLTYRMRAQMIKLAKGQMQ
jgi:hypothetical protein